MTKFSIPRAAPHELHDADKSQKSQKILAVGDLGNAHGDIGGDVVEFAEFRALSADLIRQIAPDVVLAPLVGKRFDCFDLAQLLVEAGFAGQFRAAAGQLPNPGLVRREIALTFPDLDFELLVLAETPFARAQ